LEVLEIKVANREAYFEDRLIYTFCSSLLLQSQPVLS